LTLVERLSTKELFGTFIPELRLREGLLAHPSRVRV